MNRGDQPSNGGVRTGIFAGLGSWLIALVLLAVNWRGLPPEMPWFFSMPWGEQQLIKKPWLGVMVLAFGMVIIVNGLLARMIKDEEKLLKQILVWGGAACELLMVLSLIRVIMVVL